MHIEENKIPRRRFLKVSGSSVLLAATASSSAIFLAGCPAWEDIKNWVPIGLATLNSIDAELQANGIVIAGPALMAFNDAVAALNLVASAAKEYGSANPPPAGALEKLQLAIKSVTDNLSAFLSALALPDGNLVKLIISLAQIVISTILAFANQLPAPAPAPAPTGSPALHTATLGAMYRVGGHVFAVAPKKRSVARYKKDWNKALSAARANGVACPDAAYMSVGFWESL